MLFRSVNVAGGVRIDEPGTDLAIALAIASAASGAPVVEGIAAFGEVGLTGRLRQAGQSERRLEECGKFGVRTVVVPAGTPPAREGSGKALRLSEADSLRSAIAQGLGPSGPRSPSRAKPLTKIDQSG